MPEKSPYQFPGDNPTRKIETNNSTGKQSEDNESNAKPHRCINCGRFIFLSDGPYCPYCGTDNSQLDSEPSSE